MRWRMLAALVAVVGALTGCGLTSPQPAETTYTEYQTPPEDIFPASCLRTAEGVACNPGHFIFPLGDDVTCVGGVLAGMTISSTSNGDGTYTVSWVTTNPEHEVVGATDTQWQNNGNEEDQVFQSPYVTAPGQEKFAIHVRAPGATEMEQMASPQEGCIE